MNIDDLIRVLIPFLRQHHGSFYTSTNMRYNPNVCHACCIWFLTHVATDGIAMTLAALDSTSKSTFKVSQRHAMSGPKMPKKMLKQAQKHVGKNLLAVDVQAIEYAIVVHQHPPSYIGDVVTFVANIVVSIITSSRDGMMIYILGEHSVGHVICLRRNVGGILIYDPNMGVMSARLADTDTWAEVLRRILYWYSENMKLNRFGYLFK